MAAMMNGQAAHGGVIPYGGTFLVFSDYARNALRMAALIGLRSIFVLTHDSIGLGEDGPTHQPIEHLASLRLMPNMELWRPCDTVETAVAWRAAIERQHGPDVPHAHAPGSAARAAHAGADRGDRAWRLHRQQRQRAAGDHADRHGLRGAARRRRGQRAREVRRRRARRLDAVHAGVRPATGRVPQSRAAAAAARGSSSKPARPAAGGATSASAATSSVSIASATRHPPSRCSSTSASPSRPSSPPPSVCCSPLCNCCRSRLA